jgi:signal transduction histidine kinase
VASQAPPFLAGGGEAGALARAVDWAATPLGPPETWSQALRSAAALVLHCEWQMILWWGPELTQIYNDAYTPVLGAKHPRAMGQRFRDCWAEVFHILGPMAEQPYRGGPASVADDIALAIDRRVPREESHFRLAYSPVPDETVPGTGIGGVLATVTEITEQVYGNRQLRTLRELAAQSAPARTVEQACELAAATLATNAWDVPFAAFYLVDETGATARLAASAGLAPAAELDLTADPWRVGEVAKTRGIAVIDAPPGALPASPWGDPPRQAIALPLAAPEQPLAYGVLVCGANPHRVLDDNYRAFFELAAAQSAAAIRDARAYADEQRRAEQLAALDRAKTAFFSNISHELRTPLTLMLGPTEDALAAQPAVLAGASLETVHRNELRLLRLVNTLLDFSRLEAGRIQATFTRLDLAELTRSLASTFQAAIERGGLRYEVDCPPVGDDLYVDRDLWEKVVLNLLSNAFKFTFDGAVRLALRRDGDRVVLTVADSGTGIPASELPRVFERFHRIDGARARTNEGSGIGLALVHDVVALHGGTVEIASELGRGTTVQAAIRAGRAHLPADRIAEAAVGDARSATSGAFAAEALRWVDRGAPPVEEHGDARILVADDNADMRDYVAGLLRAAGFAVEAVADGEAAIARARARRPDLVLCDIMMPRLDGFGVIRELRADPATASVPVIVLSARAGEEARVAGLDRGASDYLAKPFSARELVARVQAQLAASRVQRVEAEARARLEAMVMQAPVAIAIYRGPAHVFELVNERAQEVIGAGELLGRRLVDVVPSSANTGLIAAFDRVYQTGEPFIANDFAVQFARGGVLSEHRFQMHFVPLRDPDGAITGLLTIGVEITEVVTARAEAERANRAKDEFLAILGHELRNPLAPILTALEVLRMRDHGASRELAVIDRQAHHLVRLVDDLLDVSRITQGKLALQPRRVELAQIVARAVETATPLLERRGHELVVDVPAAGLVVHADLERLAQAVANLLTNAAKYTERGGRVTVRARRAGGELVLSVRDTGIGIAPEMLARVFDMFVQERQALDRASGGLGLGLTIVRSLVALHGGRVAVASEGRDRGSELTITLPAGEADASPPPAAPPPSPSRGDGRILLVDDNVDAADMLSTSLGLLGYDTRVAHDGPEALRVVASFTPDVAVLDIGLPVMDGYELAGRLRAHPGLAGLRLVALTGYGAESDRRRSAEAGFDAHLVKPVLLDQLRATLAELTGG